MGQFGFSYVGAIYFIMLFAPSLLWARAKPEGYTSQGENRVLQMLERAGEVSVTCCTLVFRNFDLRPWSLWSLWLVASFVLMALYETWWAVYFHGPKTLERFYGSMLGIPVPGAALPVAALILLGIYGRLIWMVLGAAILGIGHVGIHLQHRAELDNGEK